MRFGGEVDDGIHAVLLNHALHRRAVRDVAPLEVIVGRILHGDQIVQVARVSQFVQHDDRVVRIARHHAAHEGAADETRSTGDQYCLHQSVLLVAVCGTGCTSCPERTKRQMA